MPIIEDGFLITFEGIDGLGKTTQYNKLAEKLCKDGYDLFLTKEPGDESRGSIIGKGIRDLIFKYPTTKNMASGVADLLFLADHLQNLTEIYEQFKNSKIILCDRYADSQFAYASARTKRCPPWVLQLYAEHYGVVPDLTLLLVAHGTKGSTIVDPYETFEWALDRAKSRVGTEAGKQEGKLWNSAEEQRRIQLAYLDALGNKPHVKLIHVFENSTEEEVAAIIYSQTTQAINDFMLKKKVGLINLYTEPTNPYQRYIPVVKTKND